MKSLAALFVLFTSSILIFAQPPSGRPQGGRPPGIGEISGKIFDSTSKQVIPYATIALSDINSTKPIDGTITDDNGNFVLKNVPVGTYKITVDFIGYKKIERTNIEITADNPVKDVGQINLQSDAKQLGEVEIQGKKDLIEEKVDRTVYNAEQDATTGGGDATDVLKRVPLLSVDQDGNVSLRGSSNIRVLINNRPSTISAGSIADALKQIPADQIKTVEVITSPSAKYDAEGSGGIINIILKKNNLEGGSLNVDVSAGFRGSMLGVTGAYNKKKMRFSLGGNGRASYNIPGKYGNTQTTTKGDTTQTAVQNATTRNNNINARYTFGWDYDIDKNNFITTSVQYSARNNYTYQDNLNTQTFEQNSLVGTSLRNVQTTNVSGTWDFNFNFTHNFKKPQREISFLALYSYNDLKNNFLNNIFNPQSDTLSSQLKNINPSRNNELSFQLDFQTPVTSTQLLETGVKNIIRSASSTYNYYSSNGSSGDFQPITFLGNSFNYNQNISAAYAAYTLTLFKNYTLKGGLRDEYTTISADFQKGSAQNIPSYNVVVPSINISRKFENGRMIKAAYTRRIQRPSIQFLNPNIQASNPLNVTVGNPYLSPEFANNFELSYSTNVKKSFLTLAGFFRNNTSDIQPVRSVTGSATIKGAEIVTTTYKNIGLENNYGINFFANGNITKEFSINGGIDVFYRYITNNVTDPTLNATNSGFVYSGRIMATYSLPKNWGLQLFGFYRGKQIQLQGYQGGFGVYSLVLRKEFNEKRGSIGFGAENFIVPHITITNQVITKNSISPITQNGYNVLYNFNFKVTFTYKIGKMSMGSEKRKKSADSDDVKDAGDNNPANGMQQPNNSGAPKNK